MAPQVYLTLTPSRSERRSYYKQILLSSWLLIFGVTLIVAGFVLLVKDEKEMSEAVDELVPFDF